ncbi:hypothetical protein [Streptomyces sp. NPDC058812]|uniref:hypothetical protein n=1 Tax=unclassified Streptomyces TaxID=2593676 RepID=UPI0036905820
MTTLHIRALRLAGQLGTDPEPPLLWSLALAALTRGEWESAHAFGTQLQARAERDDDQVLSVESDYILGIAAYWPGHLTTARAHFGAAAMRHFRPALRHAHVLRYGQDPELLVRLRLAHTLWLLGHPDDADHQQDLVRNALDTAGESAHPYSRATVWVWSAILAMDRRDTERIRHGVRTLHAGAVDDAPAQIRLVAEMFAGHLDVLDGRTAAGLARVRAVRDHVMGRGQAPAPGVPGMATRLLLEDYAVAGEPAAGLALADEALGMGCGAELWEAEIRRLRASFLAALGAPGDEVLAELERALAVARRQRARAFGQRVRETLAERFPGHDRALGREPEKE